jgi:hypothetical protein
MDIRQLRIAILFGLGAASFIAFGPALAGEFLFWDDYLNIVQVKGIQGLAGENLRWMFFDFGPDIRYKPITFLAWAILHAVDGLDPYLFHLANLIVHSVNGCLLFFLLGRLGDLAVGPASDSADERWRTLAAAAVALLWTVHPLRVETSAWASVLSYSLAVFFLQVAMLCLLACAPDRPFFRQGRYWGALLLYQAGLMCFPTAIGFSFAVLAVCIHPLRRIDVGSWAGLRSRSSVRALLEVLPFFLLTAMMVAVGIYGQHVAKGVWGDPLTLEQLPLTERLFGAAYFLAYYGWRPFYPFRHFTVNEDLVGMTLTDLRIWAAIGLVIGVSIWAILNRRRNPALFVVWLAYVGLTAPVMKLTGGTPFPGPGDRYSLIPGLAWAAGVYGLVLLFRGRPWRQRICPVLAVIGFVFVGQSRARTHVWINDITFFSDQAIHLRHPVYRTQAYARWGRAQIQAGDTTDGLKRLADSWRLLPALAAQEIGLFQARVLVNENRIAEAVAVLQETRRWLPNDPDVQKYLGMTLMMSGDNSGGIAVFEEMIARSPASPEPYISFITALLAARNPAGAGAVLQRAATRFPDDSRWPDVAAEIRRAAGR